MTDLGVNVDHVATVREARGIAIPDPVKAANLAEQSGADGITIHLRKVRRHIQERDVELLRETVKTRLNLEMANTPEMIDIAKETGPEQCTLVPEERDEVTTEGGLNVLEFEESLAETAESLRESGMLVSFFVDPDPDQLKASAEAGADAIELHTGDYAEAPLRSTERAKALDRLRTAADTAGDLGLTVFAGHGLNYRNVQPIASIEPIEELNIGHALVARSVMVGIEEATRRMKDLMVQATNETSS
ncbi:MAG: pyridoxine 5'-phosphate synthase [bacterium]